MALSRIQVLTSGTIGWVSVGSLLLSVEGIGNVDVGIDSGDIAVDEAGVEVSASGEAAHEAESSRANIRLITRDKNHLCFIIYS